MQCVIDISTLISGAIGALFGAVGTLVVTYTVLKIKTKQTQKAGNSANQLQSGRDTKL